jgi:hypothetical protein
MVEPVTSPRNATAVTATPGLAAGGQRLWDELDGDTAVGGARQLIVEACRTTDRLDKLDRILAGEDEAWLRFKVNDDGDEVTVTINSVLSEVRQQATTLKQLLAELRQAGAATSSGTGQRPPSTAPAPGGAGFAGVADLTARIAQRRPQTTG